MQPISETSPSASGLKDALLGGQRAFKLTALLLFLATWDGTVAVMHAEGFTGRALSFMFALVLDIMLVGSLLEWHRNRNGVAFAFMAASMLMSGALSTNFWYRPMRGSDKTLEVFEQQRDAVVGQLVAVYDRVSEAAAGLSQLSSYSNELARREVKDGDTCGIALKVPGPRQRFRKADAEFFAGLQRDLSGIPPRIQAEKDAVLALRPIPGQTVAAAASRLRLALTSADSVLHDPAVAHVEAELRRRIKEDNLERSDGRTKFNCADAAVRTQAEGALARIEKLPASNIEVDIPDFSNASEGLRIIPLLFDVRSWGKKGGLSPVDAAVVLFAVVVEAALFYAARGVARDMAPDRAFRYLPRHLEPIPNESLTFLRTLVGPPEQSLLELSRLLQRYQAQIGFRNRLVVAYGCADKRAAALAWYAPTLAALGFMTRDRWMFGPLINLIGWWKWPESRGCERRESFRIDQIKFDEIHLAEVIARTR